VVRRAARTAARVEPVAGAGPADQRTDPCVVQPAEGQRAHPVRQARCARCGAGDSLQLSLEMLHHLQYFRRVQS
jgi:hypothetical protein